MQDWTYVADDDLFLQLPSFIIRLYRTNEIWYLTCVNMNLRNVRLTSFSLRQAKREAVAIMQLKMITMVRDIEKINVDD